MWANKRKMILESIAVMFLCVRSDVTQPRRCTSEVNEHTFGMVRQMSREFTILQFIRLVDKVALRLDALFTN